MNQPKFKFGDKLEVTVKSPDDGDTIFEVTQIHKYGDAFTYSNGHIDGYFQEEHVRLVVEPQKKKLYAYKNHNIVMFTTMESVYAKDIGNNIFISAPEYDIEYPETN